MLRQNNFDFLRLLFSSLVILSHSFPLTNQPEILILLNQHVTLGEISVQAFFVMSGYLIFTSMKSSKSLLNYFWKRCIRLFPGLFIMLLLTIIYLPFLNSEILKQEDYYTYLPNCLSLFFIQHRIANVFVNNPYPFAINGSLWSLSYEFLMYIYIGFLFVFRGFKYLKFIVIPSFFIFYIFHLFSSDFLKYYMLHLHIESLQFYRLATFFMAGACLTYFKINALQNKYVLLIMFTLFVLSIKFEFYNETAPFIFTLLLIPFAISYHKRLQIPKYFGDISYGVYIYGFIVQQSIMYFLNLKAFPLFITSIIITYTFAYFSWHYIEKKALKWKSII